MSFLSLGALQSRQHRWHYRLSTDGEMQAQRGTVPSPALHSQWAFTAGAPAPLRQAVGSLPADGGVSPPRPRLLFLGVLSLNPAPLSCLHSPRGTLALRSPFPPSEIVSISPTPPRIVGSGPCLLPRVLVLRSLCGPTFPPRPAWLADASSGPQDSVGEGDGHLQKIDPRSSFLKLFCTEEPHGISVKNSDSWAIDIEPVGLGTFYTVAWSDSDPGVGTTV